MIVFIAAKTSSESNKFLALEIPFANYENKIHLILILLSPLTFITLLKQSILFLMIIDFDIKHQLNLKSSPKYAFCALMFFIILEGVS